MSRTRIGKLRHHVEVQAQTETRGDQGQIGRDWKTIAKRWASIEPLSGREFWQAQQVQSTVTHRVKMRHYDGLDRGLHRLRHRSRTFNIQSILDPMEQREMMELLCVENVAAA